MGIHSYRSRQVVDFERLGAEGLFGIFGPTGSGKSSILDAISLALYGGVERASNNTRGIVNQLEKALEVSFEFELGESRYRVERRYDRNPKDHEAAVAKQARLRQLTADGERVLASKPQEVTAQVEMILGIRREEFSRAVVLPQGKFDQFLRLTGGERAAMLEHLFNLEQFGEDLLAKVRGETARCNEQLQRLEGEIQGLGQCSPQAVANAETALDQMITDYQRHRQLLEALEASYQTALSLRDLVVKRERLRERQERLAVEAVEMGERQTRLEAAERAEPLREMILSQRALTEKVTAGDRARQMTEIRYQEALVRYHQVQARLDELRQKAETETAELQTRKLRYEEALTKQAKLGELAQDILKNQTELDAIITGIQQLEEILASDETGLEQIRATLSILQEKRQQWLIAPEEKERIQRGLDVATRLAVREEAVEKQERRYQLWKDENESRRIAIMAQAGRLGAEAVACAGEDLEQWAGLRVRQAEQELERARIMHHQALLLHSAAELVKNLQDGEPCPVCGSLDHPRAVQEVTPTGPLEAAIRSAENRLKTVRQWEKDLVKIWREWRNNEALIQEAISDLKTGREELVTLKSELAVISGGLTREELGRRRQQLRESEQCLTDLDRERESLLKKQADLSGKVDQYKEKLQIGRLKAVTVENALSHSRLQHQELLTQLQDLTDGRDLKELLRTVEESLREMSQAMNAAKTEEAASRKDLDELIREKAALEATWQANRDDLDAIEERLGTALMEVGFSRLETAEAALLAFADRQALRKMLEDYRQTEAILREELADVEEAIAGRPFDLGEFDRLSRKRQECLDQVEQLKVQVTLAQNQLEQLREKGERWQTLQQQRSGLEKRKNLADLLANLLRGRRFVSFLAQEHLQDMVLEASYQLGRLTGQRYALELAKDKDCEFVIRDDYHGGQRRAINSLSGGEVFLTSLALALALSAKIQLRGKYPLGFFFLDEGFGTLDEEKLDNVINALEKLHDHRRMVGVISHVRELRERLSRYVEVIPGEGDGEGSRIK